MIWLFELFIKPTLAWLWHRGISKYHFQNMEKNRAVNGITPCYKQIPPLHRWKMVLRQVTAWAFHHYFIVPFFYTTMVWTVTQNAALVFRSFVEGVSIDRWSRHFVFWPTRCQHLLRLTFQCRGWCFCLSLESAKIINLLCKSISHRCLDLVETFVKHTSSASKLIVSIWFIYYIWYSF